MKTIRFNEKKRELELLVSVSTHTQVTAVHEFVKSKGGSGFCRNASVYYSTLPCADTAEMNAIVGEWNAQLPAELHIT